MGIRPQPSMNQFCVVRNPRFRIAFGSLHVCFFLRSRRSESQGDLD